MVFCTYVFGHLSRNASLVSSLLNCQPCPHFELPYHWFSPRRAAHAWIASYLDSGQSSSTKPAEIRILLALLDWNLKFCTIILVGMLNLFKPCDIEVIDCFSWCVPLSYSPVLVQLLKDVSCVQVSPLHVNTTTVGEFLHPILAFICPSLFHQPLFGAIASAHPIATIVAASIFAN